MAESNFVDYVKIQCRSGKGGFCVLGDGVFLRVQEQDVFAQCFVVLFLGAGFKVTALLGRAAEHFAIPVQQYKVGVRLAFLDSIPQVGICFSYPAQTLCAAISEESAQAQGVLSDAGLV